MCLPFAPGGQCLQMQAGSPEFDFPSKPGFLGLCKPMNAGRSPLPGFVHLILAPHDSSAFLFLKVYPECAICQNSTFKKRKHAPFKPVAGKEKTITTIFI